MITTYWVSFGTYSVEREDWLYQDLGEFPTLGAARLALSNQTTVDADAATILKSVDGIQDSVDHLVRSARGKWVLDEHEDLRS